MPPCQNGPVSASLGVELKVDPDTGADVDLISKDDFLKIYHKHPEVADFNSVPTEAIRALGGTKLGIVCTKRCHLFEQHSKESESYQIF